MGPSVADAAAMLAEWQAEQGYTDEQAVAHLMLNMYRLTRVYALVQETGVEWEGRGLDEIGDALYAAQYVLSDGEFTDEFQRALERFITWRIAELHGMQYSEYLQTPEWRDIRYFALHRAGARCQVCYSAKRLEVHHRTYARRGCESLDDVTVLCRSCHGSFHEQGGLVRQ